MTAATLHRQAEHRRRDHVHHFVDDFVTFLDAVLRLAGVVLHVAQIARGRKERDRFGRESLGTPPVDQFIPGKLFGEKAVVWHIVVERPDYIVAISPDPFVRIDLGQIGVGQSVVDIARRVEPVPAPTLAVVRRGQQRIDESLVGIGLRIGEKRCDRRRFRGQTDQIEIRTTDQRTAIGLGGKRDSLGFQFRQQESVDRPAGSLGLADLRHVDLARRLKGPEAPVRFGQLRMRLQHDRFLFGRYMGFDPEPENGVFRRRQLFSLTRRHLPMRHQIDQQAVARIAGNHRRPALAPAQDRGQRCANRVSLLERPLHGSRDISGQGSAECLFRTTLPQATLPPARST